MLLLSYISQFSCEEPGAEGLYPPASTEGEWETTLKVWFDCKYRSWWKTWWRVLQGICTAEVRGAMVNLLLSNCIKKLKVKGEISACIKTSIFFLQVWDAGSARLGNSPSDGGPLRSLHADLWTTTIAHDGNWISKAVKDLHHHSTAALGH